MARPTTSTYQYPVDTQDHEPTDEECVILLRSLAHFVRCYHPDEVDISAQGIALDILESSADIGRFISRDEVRHLGQTFKIEV